MQTGKVCLFIIKSQIPAAYDFQLIIEYGHRMLKKTWIFPNFFLTAEEDTELQQPRDLQDFLLQSSDEEDVCSLELCEPQLDTEAEIMAYFDKNQTSNARQPHGTLSKYSTSSSLFSLMFKFPLQLKAAIVSLLYVILNGVLLMIFIFHFVPAVCRIQQFSRKHHEQKTEQESPLNTSLNTLVGKHG